MNAIAKAADVTSQQVQYLTFVVGKEVFAIGILGIKEIIEYGDPTSVPMMPASVRGVISLRGVAVPVVDLAVRFGRDANAVTRRTCIVIVETLVDGKPTLVGVVVDAVNAVVDIPTSGIEQPPALGSHVPTDFIAGLGKVDGKFVVILNAERVLALGHEGLVADSIPTASAAPTMQAAG